MVPSKTLCSQGYPGLHKPCPTINPASTRVPLLALHVQAERASLRSANHCQEVRRSMWLHSSGQGKPQLPPSQGPRWGWGWGCRRTVERSAAAVPGALPQPGGDAVGGAAGVYRNVLPHPSAQSRRAAPSWVPGPSSSLAGLVAGAGYCARCRGGLQSLCAHISPRAPVPQGVAAGVFFGLSRPKRAVGEQEGEMTSSGLEG